jgi:hypothetical protein
VQQRLHNTSSKSALLNSGIAQREGVYRNCVGWQCRKLSARISSGGQIAAAESGFSPFPAFTASQRVKETVPIAVVRVGGSHKLTRVVNAMFMLRYSNCEAQCTRNKRGRSILFRGLLSKGMNNSRPLHCLMRIKTSKSFYR